MCRVVVIGGTGFVGRRLLPALHSSGYDVISASRSGGPGGGMRLDIRDPGMVCRLFHSIGRVDAVVHLAAIAHRRPWEVRPGEYDRVNHRGLRYVLHAALEAGIRRFIFFSSSLVYEQTERKDPIAEDTPRRPADRYARSKAAAEDACFEAIHRGADVVVLRFPVIYGTEFLRGLRMRAYVPFTRGRLLLRILGSEPQFSLCAVENAVEAVRLSLGARIEPGAYNVADHHPYLHGELREVIAKLDGARATLPAPASLVSLPVRVCATLMPGSIAADLHMNFLKLFVGSTLDTSKIESAGFGPTRRLQDLLAPQHSPSGVLCC